MEQELTAEEKWNKATLANNFIFYKVMRSHPEECKHLIEMLLKLKIQKMEMRSEEVIAIDHDAKSIRLDVYVKDESKMYDIEIQIADTLELPERARYYAALMALDSLKEGDDYKNLRDGHVIFLCMKDIFHQGLPVYTFENVCNEDNITKLNDRDYKHFFIAPLCARMAKDKETKDFFEFLISSSVKNKFTSKLSKYVEDAKHNQQWRHEYMTYERLQNIMIRYGKDLKAMEDAENMLKKQYPVNDISEITGLPLEKVKEIAEQLVAVPEKQ